MGAVCKGGCSIRLADSISGLTTRWFEFAWAAVSTLCAGLLVCCLCKCQSPLICAVLAWGGAAYVSTYAFGVFSARTFTGPSYVSRIFQGNLIQK